MVEKCLPRDMHDTLINGLREAIRYKKIKIDVMKEGVPPAVARRLAAEIKWEEDRIKEYTELVETIFKLPECESI